jgi:hypothetical protein
MIIMVVEVNTNVPYAHAPFKQENNIPNRSHSNVLTVAILLKSLKSVKPSKYINARVKNVLTIWLGKKSYLKT